MILVPNSESLREANDCHWPAGSAQGGQFCGHHGTNVAGLQTLAATHSPVAAWFSASKKLATEYADAKQRLLGGTRTVYTKKVRVRNPYVVHGDLNDKLTYAQWRKETGLPTVPGKYGSETSEEGVEQVFKRYHFILNDSTMAELRKRGHDSVLAKEGGVETLGVFRPVSVGKRRRRLREFNSCHNPSDGRFCQTEGPADVGGGGGEDYRGQHEAPDRKSGAPAHDLTSIYPEDIYGPMAARYYAHYGDGRDYEPVNKVQRWRGKPRISTMIYRAVPRDLKHATINPGDWVTISHDYAREHGRTQLDHYRILKKRVRVSDLYTDGNSLFEWGYDPSDAVQLRDGLRRSARTSPSGGGLW